MNVAFIDLTLYEIAAIAVPPSDRPWNMKIKAGGDP
jgi:hypothetical protein